MFLCVFRVYIYLLKTSIRIHNPTVPIPSPPIPSLSPPLILSYSLKEEEPVDEKSDVLWSDSRSHRSRGMSDVSSSGSFSSPVLHPSIVPSLLL